MKAHVVTIVHIAAPPEEVFKFLADTNYHQLWSPSVKKIIPKQKLVKGTEYRTISEVFGMRISGKVRVRKLVRPKMLQVESLTGMLEYVATFTLYKVEGGTTLHCRTKVSTESKAFAFAKPLAQLLAKRELQSDLDALKQLVEEETVSRPSRRSK